MSNLILIYSIVSILSLSNHNTVLQENQYSFLNKVPFKDLPVSDSTSFNNYEYKNTLSTHEKKLLKLDEIYVSNSSDFITASANYKLRLSSKFNTIIITYSPSEVILITVLVNYDKDFNLIDFKMIALDEIFDNWSRVISEVKDNKLYVTSIDYSTGDPIQKLKIYSVDPNGKINASH